MLKILLKFEFSHLQNQKMHQLNIFLSPAENPARAGKKAEKPESCNIVEGLLTLL
jgi:hypothetical protein